MVSCTMLLTLLEAKNDHQRRAFTHTKCGWYPAFCVQTLSFLSRGYKLMTLEHRSSVAPSALPRPAIILVPRISSAWYCHRERLMFHRPMCDAGPMVVSAPQPLSEHAWCPQLFGGCSMVYIEFMGNSDHGIGNVQFV